MNPEGCLFHDRIRPNPGDELLLADNVAGTLDEGEQNLERAAAQAYLPVTFEQHTLDREQAKGAKGQHRSVCVLHTI